VWDFEHFYGDGICIFSTASVDHRALEGAKKSLASRIRYTLLMMDDPERIEKLIASLAPTIGALVGQSQKHAQMIAKATSVYSRTWETSVYPAVLASSVLQFDAVDSACKAITQVIAIPDHSSILESISGAVASGAAVAAACQSQIAGFTEAQDSVARLVASLSFPSPAMAVAIDGIQKHWKESEELMQRALTRASDFRSGLGLGNFNTALTAIKLSLDTVQYGGFFDSTDSAIQRTVIRASFVEETSAPPQMIDKATVEATVAQTLENSLPTLFQQVTLEDFGAGEYTLEKSVMLDAPIRERQSVTHVHLTIHIAQLIVQREGRPLVTVPEEGYIELDPYLYLCDNPEEKKLGLYYYKGGRWQYEDLNRLPIRILHYLYDMGFHAHKFAQKPDAIAEALDSSRGSIRNQILAVQKMCERLKIQPLLMKVGDDRWYLSRQLGCFEGLWG
jgi:hypothetical protein